MNLRMQSIRQVGRRKKSSFKNTLFLLMIMGVIVDRFGLVSDNDGTLVESIECIWQAFTEVFTEFGIYLSDAQIKQLNGRNKKGLIELWKKWYGDSLPYDRIVDEANQLQDRLVRKLKPNPEVIRLFEELRERKVPVAMGTSAPYESARARLVISGLDGFFSRDVVVSQEDCTGKGKPDPEVFLKAAERIQVPPSLCVVLEDSPPGIEAAKRAGMKAVAKLNKYHTREELANAGADDFFTSFKELSYERLRALVYGTK